jgi:hypothetical protein
VVPSERNLDMEKSKLDVMMRMSWMFVYLWQPHGLGDGLFAPEKWHRLARHHKRQAHRLCGQNFEPGSASIACPVSLD